MKAAKILAVATLVALIFMSGLYAAGLAGKHDTQKDTEQGESEIRASGKMVKSDPSPQEGSAVLTVSSKSQLLSGIKTTKLTAATHRKLVKAYGEVVDLTSLIELRNSYIAAKAEASKSLFQLDVSRNEYVRAKTLFNSRRYVSLEKLQSAEAAYESDLADSEASVQSLAGLKGEVISEWGSVIANWMFSNSHFGRDLVSHKLSILRIAIPTVVDIREAPRTIEVTTVTGNHVEAVLVSESPLMSPNIQEASYFYRTPTVPGLPVGMRVVTRLSIGSQATGVVVPASAVIWWNGKAWAFVRSGRNKFFREEINTSKAAAGGWFVGYGLKPGDEVVVNGAQQLLSREFNRHVQPEND